MSKKEDIISVKQAKKMALKKDISLSIRTIQLWAKERDLGYQIGNSGRWYIYKSKFEEHISGKNTN